MLMLMQGLVSPRVEVHPQLKPTLLSLAQVESVKRSIPGTLCHHLSFSLQVLPFRPVGSLFFLLVSPFFSSQAQAELSLLTPLSSSETESSHPLSLWAGISMLWILLSAWRPASRLSAHRQHWAPSSSSPCPAPPSSSSAWFGVPSCFLLSSPCPSARLYPFNPPFPFDLILHFLFSRLRPFIQKGWPPFEDCLVHFHIPITLSISP